MVINPGISPIMLAAVDATNAVTPATGTSAARPLETTNIFDNMLGRAIDSLNSVSQSEINANQLIDQYIAGKAELSDVMLATSKMTIAVNLAVTTITSAVSSFKEITQMPI